jgi:hypothetical protein
MTWQCDTHHPQKKKKIGYGQYLGAKGGFTLVLGGYPVCLVPITQKLEPILISGKFKTGPSSWMETRTQT